MDLDTFAEQCVDAVLERYRSERQIRMVNKITPRLRERIVAAHMSGMTWREMQKTFKVHINLLRSVIFNSNSYGHSNSNSDKGEGNED